jgi:hypothetical protein
MPHIDDWALFRTFDDPVSADVMCQWLSNFSPRASFPAGDSRDTSHNQN